ncbi:MAG: IS1595 family transposase [Ginsengibacter sp.]
MELNFKGLPQLLKRFPDDKTAREYFEQLRWNGTPVCPYCACDKSYKLSKEGQYKCGNRKCHKKYSVLVGTVFQSSHIPLNIWFAAMYLISSHKKGIASHQIAKDLNLTQKTAWFMLHRIRLMAKEKEKVILKGTVELDEAYMARKYHSEMKPTGFDFTPSWPRIDRKGCVFGMVERKGKVVVKVFPSNTGADIKKAIREHIDKSATIYTDDSFIYRTGLDEYKRESVTHSKREYVRGNVSTNQIENFWGVMKRGVYGTYHQVSYKHLHRYCDEFSYRYNSRILADNERFNITLNRTEGRLKYSQLISNEREETERAS